MPAWMPVVQSLTQFPVIDWVTFPRFSRAFYMKIAGGSVLRKCLSSSAMHMVKG
jgi:hypothetical protein